MKGSGSGCMILLLVVVLAVWSCVLAAETKGQEATVQGWSIRQTPNFTIHHRRNPQAAEEIGTLSERIRAAVAAKWFPGEPNPDWRPRCEVFLYPTASEYSRETGVPANSPGHTNILNRNGKIISRKLMLRLDDPRIIRNVLPHELTHVVHSGRYGRHVLPRWADEGIAVLSEPRDRQAGHSLNIFLFPRIPASEIVTATNYPAGNERPFYAHSVVICDFLERRGGPAKLVEFLRLSLDSGTYAFEEVYGLRIADLDAAFDLDAATIVSRNYCDWTCPTGTCPVGNTACWDGQWNPVTTTPSAPTVVAPTGPPVVPQAPTIDLNELSRLVAQRLPTPSQGPPGERGPIGLSITGPEGPPGTGQSLRIAIEGKDGKIQLIEPDENGIVRLPPIRVFVAGERKTVPLGGDLVLTEGPEEE